MTPHDPLAERLHVLCDLNGEHHADTCQGFDSHPAELAAEVRAFLAERVTREEVARVLYHECARNKKCSWGGLFGDERTAWLVRADALLALLAREMGG